MVLDAAFSIFPSAQHSTSISSFQLTYRRAGVLNWPGMQMIRVRIFGISLKIGNLVDQAPYMHQLGFGMWTQGIDFLHRWSSENSMPS